MLKILIQKDCLALKMKKMMKCIWGQRKSNLNKNRIKKKKWNQKNHNWRSMEKSKLGNNVGINQSNINFDVIVLRK